MSEHEISHYDIENATSSSLWVCQCGWENCEPMHSYGPAVRDHFLIHYIVKGSGKFYHKGEIYNLSAGNGFLISPNEVEYYEADENDPWEYCWVGFKGVDAVHLLVNCGITSEKPIFSCADTVKIKAMFTNMFEAFKENLGREYAMLAYLYLFFSVLSAQNGKKALPRANSSNAKIYLDSAVSYINDNYSYDINVKKLAAHIGIDRTYLFRIFKETINLSPEEYLLKVRMTKASSMLKETDCPVIWAAYSTGYKDISHFSSVFKKFFGKSPSTYRKISEL